MFLERVPTAGGPDVLPNPIPEPDPEPTKPDPTPEPSPVPPVPEPAPVFFGRQTIAGRHLSRADGPGRLPRTATPTRRNSACCFCW